MPLNVPDGATDRYAVEAIIKKRIPARRVWRLASVRLSEDHPSLLG